MSLCTRCNHGEYHGFPPEGSPEWEVGTVYFWCPKQEHHDSTRTICFNDFARGKPKMFDKRGNRMKWRPYGK